MEHKRLVALINDTYNAIITGKKRNIVTDIFNGLIDYTREHFTHEEEQFTLHGYREGLKHKVFHADLTQKVLNQYRDYINGKNVDLVDVLAFLMDWLQDHILVADKKFGSFIEQNKK